MCRELRQHLHASEGGSVPATRPARAGQAGPARPGVERSPWLVLTSLRLVFECSAPALGERGPSPGTGVGLLSRTRAPAGGARPRRRLASRRSCRGLRLHRRLWARCRRCPRERSLGPRRSGPLARQGPWSAGGSSLPAVSLPAVSADGCVVDVAPAGVAGRDDEAVASVAVRFTMTAVASAGTRRPPRGEGRVSVTTPP